MGNHYTDIYASYEPDIFSSDVLHFNSAHGGEPSMLSQLGVSKNDRDLGSVQNNFNLMPYPDTSTTSSPTSLGASTFTEGSGGPSPTFLLTDMPDVGHSESHQTRKHRKDKPRIELAPNQPPTTQGRARARVFVACLQWYARIPHRGLVVLICCH